MLFAPLFSSYLIVLVVICLGTCDIRVDFDSKIDTHSNGAVYISVIDSPLLLGGTCISFYGSHKGGEGA